MDDNLQVQLERAKMKNYILEKENELLLGMIGIVTKDKEILINDKEQLTNENKKVIEEKQALIEEIEKIKAGKSYKLAKGINKMLRRN